MSRKKSKRQRLEQARESAKAAAKRQLVTTQAELPAPEEEPEEVAVAAPEPTPPPLIFAVEDFRSTIAEAVPMSLQHGEELGLTELPWRFKPAFNAAAEACDEGRAVWMTARTREGEMAGYALFFMGPGFFLRDTLVATCAWLYVEPAWRVVGLRPTGLRFLQFCEAEMVRLGAGLIEIAIIGGSALEGLMPKIGYEPAQTVFWKDLSDKEQTR